jgi:predicted PurR-regulated permease PerM
MSNPTTDVQAQVGITSDGAPAPAPPARLDVPSWFRRVGTNSWLLIGTVIAVAGIIALIAATRDITGPLAIGVFLAIAFVPVVNWLEDHGIKRAAGSALVIVGLVAMIVGAGFITGAALGGQSDVLTANLGQAVDDIKGWVEGLPVGPDAVEEIDATARDAAPVVRDGLAPSVATVVDSAAGFVAGLIHAAMARY